MNRLTTAIAMASITLVCTPAYAGGLDCPVVHDLDGPPLTPAIEAAIPKGERLSDPLQLQRAIALLRGDGVSTDNTINLLIGYYCPAVDARSDLSVEQKTENARLFAQKVSTEVLAADQVEDVIYNVPLNPSLAQAAAERAKKAGMSIESWIARTVEAALQQD
ncbi:hypothetical protein ACUSIJ_04055 [Pseudochelatococcus sp. B33]